MTVIKEDGGRTNIYAKEPQMYYTPQTETMNEFSERLNGRLAMLGVIAAIGAYAVTGQLIPGVFWPYRFYPLWIINLWILKMRSTNKALPTMAGKQMKMILNMKLDL